MIPPSGVQLSSVMEGGLAQLSATAVVGTEPTTYSWSESGVLTEGDSVVLTATATGSEPLSYQWYYAGKLIEDVTANSLRLANVQDTISGEYQVVVTNEVGSDTS
jgi:hypothetical protein